MFALPPIRIEWGVCPHLIMIGGKALSVTHLKLKLKLKQKSLMFCVTGPLSPGRGCSSAERQGWCLERRGKERWSTGLFSGRNDVSSQQEGLLQVLCMTSTVLNNVSVNWVCPTVTSHLVSHSLSPQARPVNARVCTFECFLSNKECR